VNTSKACPSHYESGVTYTAITRVYFDDIDAGINDLAKLELGLFNSLGVALETDVFITNSGTNTILPTTPDRKWFTLRLTYESSGETDATLRLSLTPDATATATTATFYVDDVYVAEGGLWEQEGSRNYYGETRHVSLTHGASASFTFTGTGFSIGTELNRDGGEMEICYTNGTTVDECLVVPNEGNARDILRTVAGLPLDTYDVVIRDVEDGYTTTRRRNLEARSSRNAVGQLVIDFVQIHNNNTPTAIGDGIYDDTENELLYLPADRWLVETGSRASRNYGGSYTTMAVDGREQRNVWQAPASSWNYLVATMRHSYSIPQNVPRAVHQRLYSSAVATLTAPSATAMTSVNRRDDYTLVYDEITAPAEQNCIIR
jgi:hypothetical protein